MAPQKKILVVDDEDINRRVLSGLLKSFDFEPLVAESGVQAMELIDTSVDLVLLDIMMPFMDGFATARAIRANPAYTDTPIIMVTALSAKEDRLKATEAGANDFISKPIDSTELRIRMASLLRMKAYHDEIKVYQNRLEQMVDDKTRALRLAIENLKDSQQATLTAHRETLHKLSAAAEFKDEDTGQHISRMSHYSALLARKIGLAGENIPLYGRICAVADIFDALTSRRPYKGPYSNEEALKIMAQGRGTHFDPRIYDAFLDSLEEFLEIQRRFKD